MTRVSDPADPNRCKGATREGQCRNEAKVGSDYCHGCGGRRGDNKAALEEQKRQYHLTEATYRARLAQLAEHSDVKSLRDEIALTRLLIEKRFNLIKTDSDFINACGQLNSLLLTAERLNKSAHSIEQSLGVLLTRDTVLRLGQSIVEILADELKGIPDRETIIDRIVERMFGTISNSNNMATQPKLLPSE